MYFLTEALFWIACFLVIYPYVIYPPLLKILCMLRPRRADKQDDFALPRISFVISAYNEAAVINDKLDNALAMEYPADSIEFLVVSDASDDGTDDIVLARAESDSRIRLIRQEERKGKSAGLNTAVAASEADILVFSDANAIYEKDALNHLVAEFADPAVGYAVGAALYYDADGSAAGESEGLYWKLELWLKRHESRFDSVVGGDGAIYAVRRNLFWDLQDDDISDFVNPIQVIAAGYKGVFQDQAKCYEHAGEEFEQEFRRKRRIVNRSWRAVCRYGGRLDWAGHRRFVFMLISHKVLRWFALPLVALAWSMNTVLLGAGADFIYFLTWIGITASIVFAFLGASLDRQGKSIPRLVYLSYYFYFVNAAGILGVWDEARGVRHATWTHIRAQSEAETGPEDDEGR